MPVSSANAQLLMVDDDEDILHTARMFLKQYFPAIRLETDPSRLPSLLAQQRYDVLLLDMNFQKGENDGAAGLYWLERVLLLDPDIVIIPMTAYGDVELAVQALKLGAVDFVQKPWKNEKLLATVLAAWQLRQSKGEVARLRTTQQTIQADICQGFGGIIGSSPAIGRVYDLIEKVASTDANVLVLGENGTGKELVARSLHEQSLRRSEGFISVDLGAISETLFESELFGHVKGAFTDAREDKPGRFELASGGTLFLDEIGNLSLTLQAKLLTVLQNRTVTRVGSHQMKALDIRLICATNMPLHEMVADKTFRPDLLYRINTVEIRMPSLRERVEDIPLLFNHFLHQYGKKYRKIGLKAEKQTLDQLKKYAWPGNIRELQHAVERAVILSEGKVITANDLFSRTPTAASTSGRTLTLEEVEKNYLIEVIHRYQGNISKVALELGMTRPALYRRINKYGL
ncbi:MAG: sigma-54 dependent transcriptional regulator [Bacteroidota bacterium]